MAVDIKGPGGEGRRAEGEAEAGPAAGVNDGVGAGPDAPDPKGHPPILHVCRGGWEWVKRWRKMGEGG